jgi:hypothetical protein
MMLFRGSLNAIARAKEMIRINKENARMFKALNQIKPTINRDQWRSHAR